jgi:hypothetical protein
MAGRTESVSAIQLFLLHHGGSRAAWLRAGACALALAPLQRLMPVPYAQQSADCCSREGVSSPSRSHRPHCYTSSIVRPRLKLQEQLHSD